MSLFQAKHYLSHLTSSRSAKGHGVHSPFMYELATQVLPDKNDNAFEEIEHLRKRLLKDQRTISVTDLGAGSHVHKSSKRKISAIARHSLKSARMGRFLNRLANFSGDGAMLELGTSLGLTSAYLAKTGRHLTTIEGCGNIAEVAQSNFGQLQLSNISLLIGSFDDLLPGLLADQPDFNFVFVDGNHSYDATMRYYQLLRKHLPNGAVIVFDDIYWSEEMLRAWNEIVLQKHKQITVDLFQFGLVFLREDQASEHFKLRL